MSSNTTTTVWESTEEISTTTVGPETPDEMPWRTGTIWVTDTKNEPAPDQPWVTTLTSPSTTTATTTLTPATETVSGPIIDETWTTTLVSPSTTTSTTTLSLVTTSSELLEQTWTSILTSPTTTTTTVTLTPETETVSGPTIEQIWTTVVTSPTTTTDTTTLTSVTTASVMLDIPVVRTDSGLSPGGFELGLAAFIIVMILCGLAVIVLFVWLVAGLLRSREVLVRRIIPVESNDQGGDILYRKA